MRLHISLGALAALQLLASFLLQLVVLGLLGAGSGTDAWVAAQAVPIVIYAVIAVAFQGAWQSRLAAHGHVHDVWMSVQRAAHGQMLLVSGATTLLLLLSAGLWMRWLFPGFTAEQGELGANMTQILLVSAMFNGHAALITTALRGRDRFLRAEIVALGASMAAVVAAAFLIPRYGIVAAAWISCFRSAATLAILFWLASWPVPAVRAAIHDVEGWRLLKPLLLGSSIYKSGPLVDRFWASLAPAGGLTTFNLIQTGMGAIAAVLERGISTPVVPSLARLADGKQWVAMRSLVRQTLRRTLWIVFAAAIVVIALYSIWPSLAGSLLRIDEHAARQSWVICILLTAFLYPAAAGSVIVSSFYALGDARTTVQVGVAGFALALVLKAAGFLLGGLPGLALATTIHYLGNMLVMGTILERRLDRLASSTPAD